MEIICIKNSSIFPLWMESKALAKSTNNNVACWFFCPHAFKDSTDGQYLWRRGSISSEAIFVFPKDFVDFGFYAVS